jgi:hypothetical protein
MRALVAAQDGDWLLLLPKSLNQCFPSKQTHVFPLFFTFRSIRAAALPQAIDRSSIGLRYRS